MGFSKEQIEKAKRCKTLEEFKELAKTEGINLTEEEAIKYFNSTRSEELSDDELSAIAGGGKGSKPKPKFKIGDYVRVKNENFTSKPIINAGTITEMQYSAGDKEWFYTISNTRGRIGRVVPEHKLELCRK